MEEEDHNIENVSLLISDVDFNTLNFINPFTEENKTFEASYAKGSIVRLPYYKQLLL